MNDDSEFDAWLRGPALELPDDGFTHAVMARVHAEAAARGALPPGAALAQLRARQTGSRRAQHWRWIGLAVGSAVAAAPLLAPGGLPATLQAPQLLALVLATAAAVWGLAAPALREP
jgi:hypothetical protein